MIGGRRAATMLKTSVPTVQFHLGPIRLRSFKRQLLGTWFFIKGKGPGGSTIVRSFSGNEINDNVASFDVTADSVSFKNTASPGYAASVVTVETLTSANIKLREARET